MSYSQRIQQLEKLHTELDRQIDAMERNHPGVQASKVQDMKKQRLKYRDELARLRKLEFADRETLRLDDDR